MLTRKSLPRRSKVVRLPNLGRLSKLRILSSRAAEWLSSTPGFCCWPPALPLAEGSLTSNPNFPLALPGLAAPGCRAGANGDARRAVTPPARDDWNIGGDVGAEALAGRGDTTGLAVIAFLFDRGIYGV